ncbi:hypothetical protein RSAG8_05205, partial [Rhizoctonia solani AG-8 WAC10335]
MDYKVEITKVYAYDSEENASLDSAKDICRIALVLKLFEKLFGLAFTALVLSYDTNASVPNA